MKIDSFLNTLKNEDELPGHNDNDFDFGDVVQHNTEEVDEYSPILCSDGVERRYQSK